jgi:hypothetical protein
VVDPGSYTAKSTERREASSVTSFSCQPRQIAANAGLRNPIAPPANTGCRAVGDTALAARGPSAAPPGKKPFECG